MQSNLTINPRRRQLKEGGLFKNAKRTGDDDAAVGNSWKEYWQIFTLQDFPAKCPFCGKDLRQGNTDGCHIRFWNEASRKWSIKYIILGHHNCNLQRENKFITY